MADLTEDQFGQLPDFVKADYEKVGETYKPVAELKLSSLKTKFDDFNAKYQATDAQLREILAKSEEDRTKAEQAAFERLKKEGKVDEVVADLNRRNDETKKQYEERIEKILSTSRQDRKNSIKDYFVGKYSTDDGRENFESLIKAHIDYDPETGKEIYLNDDGSASSLDRAGFEAEIQKMKKFQPVLKAAINKGGDAKGGSGGGADKQVPVNEKAKEAQKTGDLNAFLSAKLTT